MYEFDSCGMLIRKTQGLTVLRRTPHGAGSVRSQYEIE